MNDGATQPPCPRRPLVTPLSLFTAAGMLMAYAWWAAPAERVLPPPAFTAEERDAGLDRVLEEVDLNSRVVLGSLERLSRAAAEIGVRVEIAPAMRASMVAPNTQDVQDGSQELSLRRVTVRDALEVLRWRAVADFFVGFDYRAEKGMIYVAWPGELKSLRIYEVGHLGPAPKGGDDGLADLVQTFIEAESWSVNGGTCSARRVGNQLAVIQTQQNHWRIEEFLYMLAAVDAEGRR